MMQYIFTAVAGLLGIVVGSLINYLLYRHLIGNQTNKALDRLMNEVVEPVKRSKELKIVRMLLKRAKEFAESEEAGELLEELKRILKEL